MDQHVADAAAADGNAATAPTADLAAIRAAARTLGLTPLAVETLIEGARRAGVPCGAWASTAVLIHDQMEREADRAWPEAEASHIAAAARWHASLDSADAAALRAFDAHWP
ncbi:post-segregation antitoxin (ccd killing protein) [Actinoplanes tereljensis]|nr:hypothetical protein [Actinoplanes tereljensis]